LNTRYASPLFRRCQCVSSSDARRRRHRGGPGALPTDGTPPEQLVSKLTAGKRSFAGIAAGLPAVILTTTGAKSGSPAP
jgi:hypothetical protein